MTQRDKWAPREVVLAYYSYCDQLRAAFNRAAKFHRAEKLTLTVVFKAEGKEHWGKPHNRTPDLDNIIKGVMDALLIRDETVQRILATKEYGPEDLMVIELEGVE